MKKNTIIKTCLYLCAVLCLVFAPVLGLRAQAPDNAISWKAELRPLEDSSLYELVLSGRVVTGWHTYSCTSPVSPLELTLTALEGCSAEGELYDITVPAEEDGLPVFYGKFSVGQKIRVEKEKALVAGHITWMACDEFYCTSVTDTEFSVTAGGAGAGRKAAAESDRQSSSLWALILEAILWGLAMLLTPCVFPMVPMTVSFFLKGSGSASVGRFKASMYGLFIVLLYTVPISVIILLTWLFGGDAVTADI
ncbi:MAG: thiol:disulfide interchange protein, partial [Bacteroidales bacterium]|nr:thiol:disulfide interchange protein [Bacteroidales bacterium]